MARAIAAVFPQRDLYTTIAFINVNTFLMGFAKRVTLASTMVMGQCFPPFRSTRLLGGFNHFIQNFQEVTTRF
jgi:hypothetical protein